MKRTIVFSLALATLPLLAQEKVNKWDISKVDVSKLPAAATDQGITYDKDIGPMLKACSGCHGEQRQRGGLRLDSRDAILKGGKDAKVVVAGDSAKSLLVAAAARIDDKIAMPPKRGPGGRGGPGGPGGPGGGPPPGGPDGPGGPGGPPPGGPPDGGPPGANSGGPPPGGPGGPGGPHAPPKPLTPEQVGLLRAWIDQGAN
jgi:hypothetical protein